MATEIDKRVVEMQFDNKNFEKNCQASLTTLEKLKMALNFDGAKGLESMAKAADKIDLSNLSKAADEVTVKFDAMNVVGMTAISELTKGLINFGKKLWSLSLGQMKNGGMARTLKIEQATFQMEALAKNMDVVKKKTKEASQIVAEMKDAVNTAVSGTAYGYDAAAAVAAQLMASGLDDAKAMLGHLRAISGAAAMTGRSFEDIGNIFTTVASNGRLMTMQLRQFSASGLNLSATLAQDLGKTEEQINQMVTKGEISFQQFSDALQKAFGEAAGKADDTYAGVTKNIKAQLSRIGQLFTDPFVEHIIPVLKDVKQAIKNFNVVLQPIAKTWTRLFKAMTADWHETIGNLDVARLQPLVDGFHAIFVSIIKIGQAIKEGFREIFPKKSLDQLIQSAYAFDQFARSLIPTQETLDGLKEMVKPVLIIFKALLNLGNAVITKVIKPVFISLSKLVGSITRLFKALKPITDHVNDTLNTASTLNDILDMLALTIVYVITVLTKLTDAIGAALSKATNSTAMKGLLDTLRDIGSLLLRTVCYALYLIIAALSKLFSYVNTDVLSTIFGAFARILEVVVNMFGILVNSVFIFIQGIANGDKILKSFIKSFNNGINALMKFFDVGEAGTFDIEKLVDKLVDKLKELYEHIKSIFQELTPGKVILLGFGVAILFLIHSIDKLIQSVTKTVNTVNSGLNILTTLKRALGNFATYNPVVQMLFALSVALVAITSSLVTLANDTDPQKLMQAAAILGAFAVALMGFAFVMQKIQPVLGENNKMGISNVAAMMAGIAISLVLLANATKTLASINLDLSKVIPIIGSVVTLLVGFAAAIAILHNTVTKTTKTFKDAKTGASIIKETVDTSIISMLGLALSLKILVGAIKSITTIDVEGLKNNFWALIVTLIAFSSALALIGIAHFGAGGGFGALAFVGGLYLLVSLINKLATGFNYDSMITGLKGLAALLSPILGFVFLMGQVAKLSGGIYMIDANTKLINGIVRAILTTILAVVVLGALPDEMVRQGIVAVSALALLFTLMEKSLFKTLKKVSDDVKEIPKGRLNELAKLLKALGACLLILSAALVISQFVDPQSTAMLNMTLLMLGLGLLLHAVVKVSGYSKNAKIGPIIAVLLGIAGLIGMIAILTIAGDPDSIMAAGLAVAAVTAALAIVFASISKMPMLQKGTETIMTDREQTAAILAAVALVMLACAGLVIAIGKMDYDKIPWALGIVLGTLVLLRLLYGNLTSKKVSYPQALNVKSYENLLIGLSAFILAVSGFCSIMSIALKNMDAGQLTTLIISLSAILGVFLFFVSMIKDSSTSIEFTGFNELVRGVMAMSSALVLIIMSLGSVILMTSNVGIGNILAVLTPILIGLVLIIKQFGNLIHEMQNVQYFASGSKSNEIEKTFKGMGNLMMQFAASLAIMSGAIGLLAVIATRLVNQDNVLSSIAIFGTLILSYFGTIALLAKYADKLSVEKLANMKGIASAVFTASLALAVIAGAMAMLSVATRFSGSFKDSIFSFIAVAGVFFLSIFGLIKAANKLADNKVSNIETLAKSIVIASTALLAIAGAMAMLSLFTFKENSTMVISQMITALIAIMTGMGILAYAIDSPTKLLAIAGAIVLACGSLLIISSSLVNLARISSSADISKNLEEWSNILKKLMEVFVVLAAVGAIVGAIGGATGSNIVIGIGVGIAALIVIFDLFAGGVLIFSAAVKNLAEAAAMFNNINVDAKGLADKISQAIEGVCNGIMRAIPSILGVVGMIAAGVFAIILAIKNKAIIEGIATALAFMAGIWASLPAFLYILEGIVDELINWFKGDDVVNKFKELAYFIGEIISSTILGVLSGLLAGIGQEIGNFKEKYGKEEKEEHQRLIDEADKKTKDKAVKNLQSGQDDSVRIFNDIREYSMAERAKMDEIIRNWNNENETTRGLFIDEMINTSKQRSQEDYDKIAKEMARGMINTRQGLSTVSDEFYYDLAKAINMPAESLLYLDTVVKTNATTWNVELQSLNGAYDAHVRLYNQQKQTSEAAKEEAVVVEEGSEDLDQLASSAENAANKSGTLVRPAEDAAESVEELGEKTEEAAKKTNNSTFNFNVPGYKELLSKFDVNKLKELGSGMGSALSEAFGDSFGDLSLTGIMEAIKKVGDGDISISEAMGTVLGTVAGENYTKSFEEWVEYGEEEIVAASGKRMKRYLAEGFANVNEYAQAMEKKYTNNENIGSILDFGDTIDELTESLSGGSSASSEFADSFSDMGKSVSETAEKTKSKLQEFKDSLKESISSSVSGIFNQVAEEEIISPKEMLYRLTKNSMAIAEWARNISILAARGMSEGLLNELKDMGPEGADKVKSFVMMTDQQLQEANRRWSAASAMPDVLTKEITNSYKEAGFNASLGFKQGIDKKAADEAMRELAQNSLDSLEDELEINSPSRKTMRDGEFATQGFAKGVTSEKSVNFVKQAATAITNIFVNSMRNNLSSTRMVQLGQFSIQGLVQGFQKTFPTATNVISDIAKGIASIFPSEWQIKSPSKLFENFGFYAMAGLGKGFEVGTDETSDELNRDSDYILKSMKENLTNALSNVSEDSVYHPTIQPVFDLSALDRGYNDIQSWFTNNPGLTLSGNIKNLTPTTRDAQDDQRIIDAIHEINNDDVVREITALRSDISELQTAMSGMRVVMNSKALVGQIVTDMDAALGNRVVKNQRGRY